MTPPWQATRTGTRACSRQEKEDWMSGRLRVKYSALRALSLQGGVTEPSEKRLKSSPAEKCLPVDEITRALASAWESI
jgi:hypothetical protein